MRMVKLCSSAGVLALVLLMGLAPAGAVTFKPYGYIKTDLAVDFGNPNIAAGGYGSNYVRWVDPKPEDRPMTWGFTARQSRIGFDFIGDEIKEVQVMGRIEADFTNPSPEYTNALKLRKAYLKLTSPTLDLVAGQESDIFSPLVPSTVNYLVAWWAGNIGFRRPVLALTYKMNLAEKTGIDITAGVERTIGTVNDTDNYDVAYPTLAGRIGFRSPTLSLGVSGHYGTQRDRATAADGTVSDDTYDSFSANLDLLVKLGSLSLSGEAYYGKNLAPYLGGIGMGVVADPDDATKKIELVDLGGWGQLGYTASDRLNFNLGGSVSMPTEDDVPVSKPTRNMSVFANANYMMAKDLWVAVEGSLWKTDYKEPEGADTMDSDDYRGQLAFIYYFK